jgi:hypothetical protein
MLVTHRGKPSELPDLGVFKPSAPPDLAKFFKRPATRLPKFQRADEGVFLSSAFVASTDDIQHYI